MLLLIGNSVIAITFCQLLNFDAFICFQLVKDKRKASMDNMMHQPPLKKLVTDSSMGVTAANSLPVDMPGASGGYSTNIGAVDSNLQSSRPLTNNNVPGSSSRKEIVGGQRSKTSAALDQAWREDVDAARLLPLLYEYFGESMLSFVPSPEASLFL